MNGNATIADVLDGRARWCVVERDALAVLAELPAGCVDAVVTDPPYSSGGMFRGDRTLSTRAKYVQSGATEGAAECPEFTGDGRDQRSFCYWCALWMAEALRVAVPGGVLATFADWRQLPIMSDAVQCGGWIWRGIVPWSKPGARPSSGRFTSQCEYVVWATSGPRSGEAIGGRCLPGFYEAGFLRGDDREHIAQKPVDILRNLVQIAPERGVVLDPFAGSGTTGVAAVIENRRAICCELVPEHAAIARARIAAAEAGTDYRRPQQGGLFDRPTRQEARPNADNAPL